MARTLSVRRHPTVAGWWIIRYSNTIVASLVQPNVSVELGLLPTVEEARKAVLEVAPSCGVTESTPIRIDGRS